MRKHSTNPRGAGAYLAREIAELAILVAVLAIIASFTGVPTWLLVGLPAAKLVASAGFYVLFVHRTLRRRGRLGAEDLVGRVGRAATPLRPTGQVKIDGELWSARSTDGSSIARHEEIEVVTIRGNTVLVSRSVHDG